MISNTAASSGPTSLWTSHHRGPPQPTPTSLYTARRTTHPPAHQHMGHHGSDHPMVPLQRACPRLGTPLPTLSTTLPDTHTVHTKPPATVRDLYVSDTPVRPAWESPSPPPKRRRLARPPPEPPPQAQAPRSPPASHMATLPTSSPRSTRSPGTILEGADHG